MLGGEVRRAETFWAQRTWGLGVRPLRRPVPPSCVRLGNGSRSRRGASGRLGAGGRPGGGEGGAASSGARGSEGRRSPPPARGRKPEHRSGRPQNFCPCVARQQPFSRVAGTRVTMATAPRRALRVFKEQARAAAGSRKAAFRATAASPPATTLPAVPSPLAQAPSLWPPAGPSSPARPWFWGWPGSRRCGAGSRAPGGREGRDAVQCCSFPRQYCTRPGLRPPRPPGLPLAPSGPAPALLAVGPDDLRWTGVSPLPP